jgi:hypothetical protein
MSRITRQNVESSLQTLNQVLGLPAEFSIDGEKQNGHIFLQQQNGHNNIYQNCGVGASSLAAGLTMRQAHEWISAALQGIQMAKGVDTSR